MGLPYYTIRFSLRESLQQPDIEQIHEDIGIVYYNLLHQITFKCLRTVPTDECKRLAALEVLIRSLGKKIRASDFVS